MIRLGDSEISTLYVGAQEASKAYLGDTLVWEKSSDTLYDYECVYLRSDGNQYIVLPIYASEATDAIEIDFQLDEPNTNQRFCCPESGETVFHAYITGNTRLGFSLNGSWSGNNGNHGINTNRHKFKVDYYNGRVTFDNAYNINIGTSSRVAESYLVIFKSFVAWPKITGKLFGVKYWRSDVLTYDLVPVVKDGLGGMYDTLSRELFFNAGTGYFGHGGHTFDANGKLLIDADGKYLDVKLYNTINL